MDNVQNCDSYINIPSSQTYRSKLQKVTNTATSLPVHRYLKPLDYVKLDRLR
jgi:hypothetical protein